MWGLAHGGGWASEPTEYIEAITAIESENNMIENEEIEAKSSKGNAKVTDGKESMRKAPEA